MKELTTPNLVKQLQTIANKPQEYFVCLTIGLNRKIIKKHYVYKGSMDKVEGHPQQVYRRAAIDNAYMIVIAHNHPAGEVEPSDGDISTTQIYIAGGRFTGIKLYDHIIVSGKKHYSFRQHGQVGPLAEDLMGEFA